MRQSVLTVTMLVLVAIAWALRDLIMLVGFAALLAYALDPIVSWAEHRPLPGRRRLSRGVAAASVSLLLVLVVGAALAAAVPRLVHQLAQFAQATPGAVADLQVKAQAFVEARGWGSWVPAGTGDSSGPVPSVLGAIQHGSVTLLARALGKLSGIVGIVLLPLFTFYILADRERGRSAVLARIPEAHSPSAVRASAAVDRALHAYVRGQALVCLAMGAATALVLQLIGFRLALLLGLVAGLAEIIPILGFWIAALAIALEGYSKSPGFSLAGVAAYIVVNNLMQTFVSPHLLGRQVKLHPLVVNVSVIGGGLLLGPLGAILALPAAAVTKALLDEFAPRRDGKAA